MTVQDGKTLKTEVEYVTGLKFDRGYISPYFINDKKKMEVSYDNPIILLATSKVQSIQ